ncbi:MFS transporter [Moheibacter sediminis]|uniref:MFS transporter, UMF1 family n=1 Tax=Moheibacter sediminis TaxID=1434700 RepID=A0A1W2BQE2_9FLAO|nr:MFS transporter [Moheibacter sediminis]SMC75071.1 MFS transporter, UMF1 family [Moheibacter sediminis]
MFQKNNPKVVTAWKFYDWANSVHSLVIASAVFPIYYSSVTKSESPDAITFLGIDPASAFTFSLALCFFIVILLSPILSSIADTIGNKKIFLKFFCYLGSLSCIGLFFFTSENIWYGLLLNVLAGIGYWGSMVFYNAYLPEIVTEDRIDKTSAQGFMVGYVGSVILLILCLVMIMFIGKNNAGFYTRLSFVLVGLWWMGFAQITFNRLPTNIYNKKIPRNIIQTSFRELFKVWGEIKKHNALRFFLGSFFFYSLGMQTIFLIAAIFGEKEIGLTTDKLIMTILLIQIEAILGAWLFSFLSGKIGNRNTLLIGIFVWVFVCLLAFFINKNSDSAEMQFYIMAALVGLVMGGLQALSRSTYAKLLPPTEDHTTYFSFYDIFEKIALCLGLFIFGIIIEMTNGMKVSALAMGVSFAISFIIMCFLKMNKTKVHD